MTEIKHLIVDLLIKEGSPEEDQKQNTDLLLLNFVSCKISCRVRKFEYLKFKEEFTIRSKSKTGAETEIQKIIQGFGDFFFYGFADQEEKKICHWRLIDLKRFRLYFARLSFFGVLGQTKKNNDGSSDFLVFRYSDFPPDLIFAKGDNIEKN